MMGHSLGILVICFISTYILTNSVVETTLCPSRCECNRNKSSVHCISSDLSYIPRLPKYVTELTFGHNFLPNLTLLQLRNLTVGGVKLKKLKLLRNDVKHISEDAFKDLKYLKTFTIREKFLNQSMLAASMHSFSSTSLTQLTLEDMNWTSLHSNIFHGIRDSNVTTIKISYTNISSINSSVFSVVSRLQNLDISSNRIVVDSFDPTEFSKLKVLDISNNHIYKIHFCAYNLVSLEKLYWKSSLILTLKSPIKCLPKLQYLNLNRNNFAEIHNNVFAELPRLKTLSLNRIGSIPHGIKKNAFNSSSLTTLYLEGKGHNFEISNKSFDSETFAACNKLEVLKFSQIDMHSVSSEYIKAIFSPLCQLNTLYFETNNVKALPHRLLSLFPKLRFLSLSGNNALSWINMDIFWNVTSLQTLKLDQSYISVIKQDTFPAPVWNSLIHLSLTQNPFACTCELLWFMKWIQGNEQKLVDFGNPTNYTCHTPSNYVGLPLLHFKITEKDCEYWNTLIWILIVVSSIGLILLIVVCAAYRYRWYIKYWIYLIRIKRRNIVPVTNFTYDGFVIYCDDDREWVHDTFVPKLEKDNVFTLCIHFRDFQVGRYIIDNIVDSMNQSRKIILVLSKSFLKSEWCNMELRIAQQRCLLEGNGILIVVMLEELTSKHISGILKTMITTTTYAAWTQHEAGNNLFWEQVFNAINSDIAYENDTSDERTGLIQNFGRQPSITYDSLSQNKRENTSVNE